MEVAAKPHHCLHQSRNPTRPSTFCAIHLNFSTCRRKGKKCRTRASQARRSAMSRYRLWYVSQRVHWRNCADLVDTRGSLRNPIQSLHTRTPKSTHTQKYTSRMLTLVSVFCPSRIPRSSSTRLSFSPTPAWKKSLYTAAHTGNRWRTTSRPRNGLANHRPFRG